ncbi:hypothetical protein ENKNEFLB_02834 [Nocardioides aquaticus]|uniref:Uncharacterized protein n=1 Tax=Nocardioides aquaticus TaxID=160826 RepID=A0ABX8EIV1_9ACTN|nr:hypothetical protein [Nocardioides aquaticus]QVT80439.1 hypothetical protein ENKNEFLB_02834 [Nocardioides aquaticus]
MTKTQDKTQPTTPLTVNEYVESLTGYEEDGILKHFGAEVLDLLTTRPIKAGRGLIYVDRKRGGDNDTDAVKAAMSLSMRDVDAYFTPEPVEVDPDEPETPEGKDDSQAA